MQVIIEDKVYELPVFFYEMHMKQIEAINSPMIRFDEKAELYKNLDISLSNYIGSVTENAIFKGMGASEMGLSVYSMQRHIKAGNYGLAINDAIKSINKTIALFSEYLLEEEKGFQK